MIRNIVLSIAALALLSVPTNAQQVTATPLKTAFVFSSQYGTVCDGSTDDHAAMENFLAAVAANVNTIGVITGSKPGNAVCYMANNTMSIRGDTHIMCALGVSIRWQFAGGRLVTPFGFAGARTFRGIFEKCYLDGTSSVTYASSIGVDLFNASDWIVRDTQIINTGQGVQVENNASGSNASYYNRIENVIVSNNNGDCYAFLSQANSNILTNSRCSQNGGNGVYCAANDNNTMIGGSLEQWGTGAAINVDSNCTNFTEVGVRMEQLSGTHTAILISATATYFTNVSGFCAGTTTNVSGTGGGTYVKAGGNC